MYDSIPSAAWGADLCGDSCKPSSLLSFMHSVQDSLVIVWSYKKKKEKKTASKEEVDQQKAAQLTVNGGLCALRLLSKS